MVSVQENDLSRNPSEDESISAFDKSKKYHVLMELGRGGTGLVSAAIARGIGGFSKLVVLKTTRPELDSDSDTVRMFLNEARLHSRMSHPNVVEVYEVSQQDGLPVIVMEYLDGQSFGKVLSRAFKAEQYDQRTLLSILCGVLEGLHYAHTLTDFSGRELGIVHRDVTPHNVMVTYDGRVKLLDFGIAKLQLQSDETKTGIIKGKLGYMPPEQAEGSPLDCRADVFAVGVMIWEVVAKRRLWAKRGDAEVIKHLLCGEVPKLAEAAPDAAPELHAICDRALAVMVEDRYESAGALLADLRAYLESCGGVTPQTEIAELLKSTCADLRKQAQERLEIELAHFSKNAGEAWAGDGVPSNFPPRGPITNPASPSARRSVVTGTSHGVEIPEATRSQTGSLPRERSSAWVAVVLIAVAGLGVGGKILFDGAVESARTSAAEVLPPQQKPTEPIAPLAPPPPVAVALSATPEQAEILLDGRAVNNPYSGELEPDGRDHEIIVRASGFVAQTRKVTADGRPLTLSFELVEEEQPAVEADTRPSSSKRRRARRPSPPPRKAAPKPEKKPAALTKETIKPDTAANVCDTPYFFDEHGIKHYRRECLGK